MRYAVRTLLSPRFHLLTAVFVLAGVLIAEKAYGLPPCAMCYWQRVPYAAIAMFSLASLRVGSLRQAAAFFYPLLYTASAGLALYHTGVERKWWQGISACASVATPHSLDALRDQIVNAPAVRCDEIAWQFAGMSMANLNLLWSASLALAGFCFLAGRISPK